MRKSKPNKLEVNLSNSRGLISVDFLFALVLCVGLSMILFALNFTLSMVEVAQYIAFSSARAHAAAHLDIENQKTMGKKKHQELINKPALKYLFNNPDGGWFQLGSLEIKSGGVGDDTFADEYPRDDTRVPQVGVRFKFVPKILDKKFFFLGSTSESNDGESFSANVVGLLIREPTKKECEELFLKKRYDLILNLDPRFTILAAKKKTNHTPLEDNGC